VLLVGYYAAIDDGDKLFELYQELLGLTRFDLAQSLFVAPGTSPESVITVYNDFMQAMEKHFKEKGMQL
jgi:hypothetical protein